jgi:hypothetical protein
MNCGAGGCNSNPKAVSLETSIFESVMLQAEDVMMISNGLMQLTDDRSQCDPHSAMEEEQYLSKM